MAEPLTRNPYVGPRTFRTDEAHLFFGREQEARTLLSLVTVNRVVLFYAQSGAGKSSLVNTRLIPGLAAKGFEVLPVGRVGGGPGDGQTNVFTFNLMITLEQSDQQPDYLAGLTLTDFLAGFLFDEATDKYRYDRPEALPASDELVIDETPWPRALIIDQFEEVLTTNLHQWPQRRTFFEQLAQALEADPYLWLVLVMRDDYIAGLDPYAELLPGQLRSRYFMQRMGYEAALQAITKPLAVQGLYEFAPGTAERLVDNLRQIRVQHYQPLATTAPRLAQGEFIEPVQLQLVCYQLWEQLAR